MKTKQLDFWMGDFGKDYIQRNLPNHKTMSSRINLWSDIFKTLSCETIESTLEIGANIGINLRAIRLLKETELYAVEPYKEALDTCISDSIVKKENAFCTSAFDNDFMKSSAIDLVFTSGVLIHIHPDDLKKATDNIVRISKKYIVCIEYFAEKEENILYRNNQDTLFKRDYGSFYLDHYPELRVRDYGFAWKRATGLDNLTWWLFEKTSL